ncbi:probable NADH dehydrogenase [ubiquinone] 1 alpha subcomplex subunit 12 [Ctenocephalides felis]|uniref:probable NADH dehydrogenase [ubiquinone] 1 alpha subcomplex subunit 12 n=1 Tax=Ctenocephalides felis TaxID=7515 RepID=UPI000E6E57DB|nr:probable NADH dehydrogenase [ubiquinone] 1 alpha subcomplex subunit 12 [Ctenocephalides felis]
MASLIKDLIMSPIEPMKNLIKIIKFNGGIRKSIYTLYRDRYGNKYYENPRYFFPTNRWVVYAEHHGLNYDASQGSPEWQGWLHHRTANPPESDNLPHCYSLEHNENKNRNQRPVLSIFYNQA